MDDRGNAVSGALANMAHRGTDALVGCQVDFDRCHPLYRLPRLPRVETDHAIPLHQAPRDRLSEESAAAGDKDDRAVCVVHVSLSVRIVEFPLRNVPTLHGLNVMA